ncbi:hypothetical protein B9Q11_04875 [Candidatus Marsarchaeota G2 archaeon ECH_B_SAG-F08]|jgi:uncharacterized protein (UPF0248 family)|uniref:MJ1316 RNA cyclic group end recognition domain-containing protein n=7 Tax=Candidatus Marsarchaeota TaxID=1978152 RepID=A0A2R6C3N1_9ARCH|nr:MAG: hypothetical protein B9Q01_01095 [Candidatus Marsarchaeota G1 archaeon OSP_D]PSN87384.1 MAG: hypothetical protein B9P99_06555 [Candidatus Marsarchaeota G1 archaeon OSP_B]PSN89112.1 MAG: hypothetical protein B9Q00_02505 [Candidatus Marsarchaeota G1 archaeon OSP_C]PSN97106.1 MAG: hypothetical protein B9Q11_04875 [Candidatus Marsarchaeota G2 archaeon ECH_B_SAG-F08]PSO03258.1 MAG: hypothetical protein B9Q10_00515 [Candidatus Marsarchaeota G2 archaeon ECH_B_SAG-E12]PSO04115.1 MAG: hypotheti
MKTTIRDLLNKIKWDPRYRGKGEIYFIDRKNNTITLDCCEAEKITDISKNYFRIGEKHNAKYIPFHRIVKISHNDQVLWISKRWICNGIEKQNTQSFS